MRMWAAISPADRRSQRELSQELEKRLLQSKQFRAALEVMREAEPDLNLPQPEQIRNGGFENSLSAPTPDSFDWVVYSRPQAQIGLDSRAHTGHGSLRILFRAPNALEKIQLSQTVIVEPEVLYRLEFYVRTEELIGVNTPILMIQDAVSGTTVAETVPLPSGTNDWQKVTVEFKLNPKHDGITIGFHRAPCGNGQICPVFGTVWYDDFSLQRINSPGPSRGKAGSAKQ
jgi:hypothetical protein